MFWKCRYLCIVNRFATYTETSPWNYNNRHNMETVSVFKNTYESCSNRWWWFFTIGWILVSKIRDARWRDIGNRWTKQIGFCFIALSRTELVPAILNASTKLFHNRSRTIKRLRFKLGTVPNSVDGRPEQTDYVIPLLPVRYHLRFPNFTDVFARYYTVDISNAPCLRLTRETWWGTGRGREINIIR